jgi:hypothetical protein
VRLSGAARGLAVAVLVALAAGLGGCFESDEERATEAYLERDYESAHELARKLAEAGNPRGLELLALMAAQGMGRKVGFAEALGLADRAIALDPSYTSARDLILERIEANAATAEAAFEHGEYARALALAGPLAEYGHEDGATLLRTLITGHYVALPGSDLSWRDFWSTCSGNTRHETEPQSLAFFAEHCAGRNAVWDGLVVRASADEVHIKMRPGRPASRHDLTLEMAEPGDPDLATPGRKVRFGGVIAERGSPSRADVLVEARLVGPAPLTAEEKAREAEREVQLVMGACQKLAEALFRAEHMPQWAIEVEKQVVAGGSPRSRAFMLTVAVTSKGDAFARQPDGGWHGVFEGKVTIQSVVARTAQVTDFTADCVIGPDYRQGEPADRHGRLIFVSLSEPSIHSAPARLRR